MAANRTTRLEIAGDDVTIVRARKRHYRRYRKIAKSGGWRAVADELGVNVGAVYNFVAHGIEPQNLEDRSRLGLPLRPRRRPQMNTDKRGSEKKEMAPEMKWWRGLPGAARRGLIASLYEMRDELEEPVSSEQ